MQKRLLYTTLIIIFVNSYSFAQNNQKSDDDFTDTINKIDKIFIRFPYEPMFKGNMKSFLTKNISLEIFLRYMQPGDTLLTDTANIKFMLSYKGEFKNILFTKAKDSLFKYEVMRLFNLSSGNWNIAQQGGRLVNSFVQFEIYFRITRQPGEIKMNIHYKQIVPPN